MRDDDLISRAAAIAEIEEYFPGLNSCISEPDLKLDGYRNGLQVAIHEINELPAVDAVPVVHAQPVWINTLDPGAKGCIWTCSCLCSICGEYVAASWKYCPNCGAKMDDEWRSEDADTP